MKLKDKEIPRVDSNYTSLVVICKYFKKKIIRDIDDN